MPLVDLDLENMPPLIVAQVKRLITQCVEDCKNRPAESRDRKVSLTMTLTPKTRVVDRDSFGNETKQTVGVAVGFLMDAKIPNRKALEFDCGLNETGGLVFNPDSPFDHTQKTLPGMETIEGSVIPYRQDQA